MLPSYRLLREQLTQVIQNKEEQGHHVKGLAAELEALPDSYDALAAFATRLRDVPLRGGWPHVEPSDLEGIWAECDPQRPMGAMCKVDLGDAAGRVEAAFLGSVAGCVLGKPLEVRPTLVDLEEWLGELGEWPLRDYVPEGIEGVLAKQGRRPHPSWGETVRERIRYVAPDDDVNYTVLGMLLLEQHGLGLTKHHVRAAWLQQLPVLTTFGPERMLLLKAGMNTLTSPRSTGGASGFGGTPPGQEEADLEEWVTLLNPRDEFCGALIRADAYGYACPGRPALAAELAWRDASWTHRRTGIYGAMFVAAAIATALVARHAGLGALEVFETALQFVPRRSRFHAIVADSLEQVRAASGWRDGYARIHGKYAQYAHCEVYQECGTLINTLQFARDVGDGICMQVMQGNDTDSFGATAGSILGAYFGPGHLEERWLAPFGDDIHTALAWFYERSLSQLAKRMGELPARIAKQLETD
ncbi:MAG: hypothetical protein AVDCRST_MAG77-3665 [uncultured Chloroflexi bacterium]|uniref:ADP-ribosylglycohydrolase n=1 Tax=uncultured Chloroflexota bacterium TaxID=166587 RepID=A0A6J4JJG5_9CHLR|nr:MAG: hypothetical protein AVDCRST_MAG77-3665 [uncultured Chloroflexota bacterium]